MFPPVGLILKLVPDENHLYIQNCIAKAEASDVPETTDPTSGSGSVYQR
jgi:hypothetical protein